MLVVVADGVGVAPAGPSNAVTAATTPTLDKLISPLMPHLYIVARNNASYTYPSKKINEWEDDAHYQDLLKIMK